jgi:hypothetical protein
MAEKFRIVVLWITEPCYCTSGRYQRFGGHTGSIFRQYFLRDVPEYTLSCPENYNMNLIVCFDFMLVSAVPGYTEIPGCCTACVGIIITVRRTLFRCKTHSLSRRTCFHRSYFNAVSHLSLMSVILTVIGG